MEQNTGIRSAYAERQAFWRGAAPNLIALFAAACAVEPRSQKASPTAEDLFRGIVLAAGPVAEAIPEIRDYRMPRNFIADPEKLAKIDAVEDVLMSRIAEDDPLVFQRFRTMVTSGDELQVQHAIVMGARSLVDAVLSIDESGKARDELESGVVLTAVLQAHAQKRGANLDAAALTRAKSAVRALLARDGTNVLPGGSTDPATSLVYSVVAAVFIVAAVDVAVAVNVAAGQALAAAISVAVTQVVTVTSSGTSTASSTSGSVATITSASAADATADSSATATADSGSTSTVDSGGVSAIKTAPSVGGTLRTEMMIHAVAKAFRIVAQ